MILKRIGSIRRIYKMLPMRNYILLLSTLQWQL